MTPMLEDQPWFEAALCRETDPEIFFPDGDSARAAKATCMRCEVRTECLNWALDRHERFGIWGGLTEHERRRLYTRKVAA